MRRLATMTVATGCCMSAVDGASDPDGPWYDEVDRIDSEATATTTAAAETTTAAPDDGSLS